MPSRRTKLDDVGIIGYNRGEHKEAEPTQHSFLYRWRFGGGLRRTLPAAGVQNWSTNTINWEESLYMATKKIAQTDITEENF